MDSKPQPETQFVVVRAGPAKSLRTSPEESTDRPELKTLNEGAMTLRELMELFVDHEDRPEPGEASAADERRDTSSLADIARILRELDGRYGLDHEEH